MKRVVFLALVLASCCASAQVTKCTLPNGKVTYGDGPCPAGASDSRVNTTANVVDGSGERAAATRMRSDATRREDAAPGMVALDGQRPAGRQIDSQACRAASRDLEMASAQMRTEAARGGPPGRAGISMKDAQRRMDAACGTNYFPRRPADLANNAPPPPPPPVPVAEPPPVPRMITDCQGAACYDNQGDINWRKGNTPYVVTPNGQTCRNVNGHLVCP